MRTRGRVSLLFVALSLMVGCAHGAAVKASEVRVGIVLFDGVEIIDFAGPYEVFGQADFQVQTITKDGKGITTAMGLKVIPDLSFGDATKFDVLLVPGGSVAAGVADKQLHAWLRERAGESDIVLSVCTGSQILAASGLLKDLTATTFHSAFDRLARLSPTTKVVRDVRWVDNGRIVTAAGLSSGIDAALHVVERMLDADRAHMIAMNLEYDWQPQQGFVRGKMADRYLPRPSIQWPKGTQVERIAGDGDDSEWFERYRISGPATPQAYFSLIAATYSALPQWTRHQADERSVVLLGQPNDAAEVTLRLELATIAADDSFEVTSSLRVKP